MTWCIRIWVFLVVFSKVCSDDCTCDGDLVQSTGTCEIDYESDWSYNVTGCECADAAHYVQVNSSATPYQIFCTATTTTTTTSATTTTTTVEACVDENANMICDDVEKAEELRCYSNTLSSGSADIAKYLLVIGGLWIIAWCIATIVVNFMHKNKGHHRWIHMYEEIGIILLALFVAVLNLMFESDEGFCKIITIMSNFFMILVAAAFMMESCFANSMVHGGSKKDGSIPPIVNYIMPIVIALIPTLITYFTEKDDYAASMIHCFVSLTSNMMWGFIMPVWMLLAVATVKSQMACLACDKTKEEQDVEQCFWAKKSAKSLVLVAGLLFSIWLAIMHAVDQLVMYLFIVCFLLCIIFGPVIFVLHTFCHLNTCKKWFKPSGFGKFYSLCPEPKVIIKEKIVYKEADPAKPSDMNNLKNRGKTDTTPQPYVGESHTQAQHFYSWLTDPRSKADVSNEILFRPKPQ